MCSLPLNSRRRQRPFHLFSPREAPGHAALALCAELPMRALSTRADSKGPGTEVAGCRVRGRASQALYSADCCGLAVTADEPACSRRSGAAATAGAVTEFIRASLVASQARRLETCMCVRLCRDEINSWKRPALLTSASLWPALLLGGRVPGETPFPGERARLGPGRYWRRLRV